MRHSKAVKWEKKLSKLFDEIDDYLEDKYGHLYPLHPARASRGSTSNKTHDGLFNVGASFSAGYGSKYGKGYIVDVEMATLSDVPEDVIQTIEKEVEDLVQEKLPVYFPDRDLKVSRDRHVFKIYGDISLGGI